MLTQTAGRVAIVTALAAGQGQAHPHVFIDVRVEVILDDQDRATAVRIGWIYDEFFSLSTIADRGLDPDGDGQLTAQELRDFNGWDMHWQAGYPGDTYVLIGERDLALGPPTDWTVDYDGVRIRSTHLRALPAPQPIGGDTFTVQVYDPGYYTAYAIAYRPVLTDGSGACSAQVWAPDPTVADAQMKAALAEYAPDQDVEADFPAVGKAWAEEVRVTCAGH
ncbi:DUF1007 family protein [Xinfangfangia pollutisoli]|uniref:DUF1007 family protein n=1 Tax=Xinfangfangia pollutisoli TaxID=2865960 RepID=UPI001CD27514|nr:DUF1007 family protein [Xinfangfangia pollutisoli]